LACIRIGKVSTSQELFVRQQDVSVQTGEFTLPLSSFLQGRLAAVRRAADILVNRENGWRDIVPDFLVLAPLAAYTGQQILSGGRFRQKAETTTGCNPERVPES
jgi:hypothetical protein